MRAAIDASKNDKENRISQCIEKG